jgi:hypothetical protein
MAFDHWCSPPETFPVLGDLTGWHDYDLDPASNRHSLVPCRVALVKPVRGLGASGRDARRDALIANFPAVAAKPGGAVRIVADGCFPWPANRRIYLNPPYSSVRPWVEFILRHAWAGGQGAAVLPLLLDSTWAHALLEARRDLARALATMKVPAVFGAHMKRAARSPVRLYAWRGRLSFLDPRRGGAPGLNGRSGSLIVTWGSSAEPGELARRSLTCL